MMRTSKLLIGIGLSLFCLGSTYSYAQVTGAAGPPPAQAQAQVQTPSPPDQGYILGPEDVLQVDVLGRSDFSTRAQVGSDGNIQLPLLGTVHASDRTALELRDDVKQALQKGGFFTQPIVVVQVVSYASRYVTILGAVGSPGLIPVDRPYRLSEILARAGGVRDNGADHVIVRTKTGEKSYAIKDLATGDDSLDPYVQPGDKIFSPNADLFYIKGEVRAPGGYPLSSHMTLTMALARGGGLTSLGSNNNITIIRKNVPISPKDLNVEILPDDVIDVGEGWF